MNQIMSLLVAVVFVWLIIAMVVVTAEEVYTIRYATYNTSSPLGPWAESIVNTEWQNDGNITNPVWCLQNNPITQEANEEGQVGQAEDCLLLRVFTPNTTSNTTTIDPFDDTSVNNATTDLLPVMIWIHGGMYLLGSGVSEDLYYGGWLADSQNMIVISINYRLGAHGFLGYQGKLGNAINTGTIDQKNAIDWTRQYIQKFGGDPQRITVAGESAGATSVNLHMANEETNQWFQQAILQSNPAGINLKPASEQQTLFRKLVKKLNCAGNNDDELLHCLVSESRLPGGMAKIIKESQSVTYINSILALDVWMTFYTWAPSVDNDYVHGQPNHVAVTTWPSDDKPVLMGTNEDEGRFFIDMMCQILSGISDQLGLIGDLLIRCQGGDLYDHTLYRDMIRLAYGWDIYKIDNYYKYQWNNPDETALEQFTLLVTDSVFTCPNYDMARAMKTYFYRYAIDAICSVASSTDDCVGYSCHGDDIATVFGSYGVPAVSDIGDCTPEQVDQLNPFVETVQRHWGYFVHHGTPTPPKWFLLNEFCAQGNTNCTVLINGDNDMKSSDWRAVYDQDGPVYFFEQDSVDNNGEVVPTMGEQKFTTHHTEQHKHTAQEVCETWASHTYKTETTSGSGSRSRRSLWMMMTALVVFAMLLCIE